MDQNDGGTGKKLKTMNGQMKLLNELGTKEDRRRTREIPQKPQPTTNGKQIDNVFIFYHANSSLFRMTDSGKVEHLCTCRLHPCPVTSSVAFPPFHPSVHCHLACRFTGCKSSEVAGRGPFGTRATFASAQLSSICVVLGIFYSLFNEPVYLHCAGFFGCERFESCGSKNLIALLHWIVW